MAHSQVPHTDDRPTGTFRPLLWFVLVLSAALNAVFSSGEQVLLGAAFGMVTLASIAALIVHHYRNRAR